MDIREIFEILVVACIIFTPIGFYISHIRQVHKQHKVFNDISIGDEYDWIIRDIDDPFELPHISHYKVVNKKATADGWFVQLENKSSKGRESVHIDYLIKNYKKVHFTSFYVLRN